MRIHQFRCLKDNYGVLLHDVTTGATAAIDAPEAGAVWEALTATGWSLTHILVTHRHHDHVGGIDSLVLDTGCKVIAPEKARDAVPHADIYVKEGDTVSVGALKARVWETPGHCYDHVSYYLDRNGIIFVGDTLFALGCGRVFDGAYDEMWQSLSRIAALPDTTEVYFGHEYTLANARFAASVEPDNTALIAQTARAETLCGRGDFTAPTTIAAEKAANPFLRAALPEMAARIGMSGRPPVEVFRELRERKNRF